MKDDLEISNQEDTGPGKQEENTELEISGGQG